MKFMVNEKRLINTFLELVKIDSESGNEEKLSQYLQKKLTQLDFSIEEDEHCKRKTGRNGNLIATKKRKSSDKTPIFFNAHMDTVRSNKGVKPTIERGIIKTDGTTILGADDKAGIAILLEAAQVLMEEGKEYTGFQYIFTVEEETGLYGAKYLNYSKISGNVGFVLDSGGDVGTVIVKAPFETDFHVEIIGKAAHAGVNPEDGINAIAIAAKAIVQLPAGRVDKETTVNVGIIRGGEKSNIVPDYVEVHGEVRSICEDKLNNLIFKVEDAFKKAGSEAGGRVKLEKEKIYEGFSLGKEAIAVKLAAQAGRKVGIEIQLASRGGGSDTNVFNEHGFQAVNLGIGLNKDHTVEENIHVKNLVAGVEFVSQIIEEAAAYNFQT